MSNRRTVPRKSPSSAPGPTEPFAAPAPVAGTLSHAIARRRAALVTGLRNPVKGDIHSRKNHRGDARAADAAIPADAAVRWLTIRGAAHNNLKTIDVSLPLGRFTCVTGVSGSGKSSLVNDILYEALARELNRAETARPGRHAGIDGLEHLDKIIAIDQTPIGRTPRSNPATYIKLFDEIRDLFTRLPDAKLRGYKPGRFSFNVASGRKGGGRCESCEGNGANRVEMDFLADVWVTCPVCQGRRFGRETLQVQYKGASIADVLDMDVQQALRHFENVPRIRSMLQTLHDVGLDYLKLGQSSTTLSGGEAQRIKLARELVKRPTGRTIYVLDEPTTGLHFEDIRRLLAVLHGFVDDGNTVIVIEHNLDVVKTADWVIDLGPEGGAAGGEVVAEGTPEDVAACASSYTGQALREVLGAASSVPTPGAAAGRATVAPATLPSAARRAASPDVVAVRGAAQHNLKGIDVAFPRNRLTVCTGVSGSGKTSFAIDTVYTEGHRRYVESLSAYARQFLGQLQKPKVDHIEGLSPAICIEQKSASKSPRSTVGTITEIYDYLRVLWARVGTRYCPTCATPIGTQSADEIVERIMSLEAGSPVILLAPVALGESETYASLFNRLKASGYARVRIDGRVEETAHCTTLDVRRKHRVEVVIDRTVVRARGRSRISEGVEHALALGNGAMTLVVESVDTVPHTDDAGATRHAPPARPREMLFSQKLACLRCGTSYEELSPHNYSFNSQMGWCETCEGLGVQRGAPIASIIRHPEKPLLRGAIAGWWNIDARSPMGRTLAALCRRLGVDVSTPLRDWTPDQRQALLYGTTGEWIDGGSVFPSSPMRFHWRGLVPAIDAVTRNSWSLRHRLQNVVTDVPCIACRGGRLRPDAAATRLAPGRDGPPAEAGPRSAPAEPTLVEICQWPLRQVAAYFDELRLEPQQRKVAGELIQEIRNRLQFLLDVGLEYLTLHRAAPTLSGGEAQRIRLASQIGSGLSGVLYVLDEPTIGLHPRDTRRLIDALQKLKRLGNTLLLVEHDREVIASADRLLDFGPRAGRHGGEVVAEGSPADLAGFRASAGRSRAGTGSRSRGASAEPPDSPMQRSLTRGYLSGDVAIPVPTNRRPVDPEGWHAVVAGRATRRVPKPKMPVPRPLRRSPGAVEPTASGWLVIRGARQNNLKNLTVPIPLSRFVCVTGVSGSGKSSLVNDILWPALARRLTMANLAPGEHDGIDGIEQIDKVINVDQSPLGATPSSNPATYTGAFDLIRELFARLPDAKVRGYSANRFSFNRPGGRCEACEGYGQKRIEMHFMPDVWVECEVCRGRRYEPQTLEVRFKGQSISDVLGLRVAEALDLFDSVPKIRRLLQILVDVGLDYVQLGQAAPTLSGGEAQRVKLAAELGKPNTGRTLYILDEPTTGLHFDDVRKLLIVLHRLVDLGNSIVVVEHNLDVLKSADWIIDLGPEAGEAGGRIVAMGTPEAIVSSESEPVAGPAADASRPETIIDNHAPSRIRSHTATALAPVLAADPHFPREVYDARAHAARELAVERGGLGTIGRDVKQPWQVDGRTWHLARRESRGGKQRRWEPAALDFVLDLVHAAGREPTNSRSESAGARRPLFAPTNWNDRASVEVIAVDADKWFLHALTGGEWLLELYFRVPAGTFDAAALDRQLGLKTLDERSDIQAYGSWPRVDVRPRADGPDAVAIHVHDKAEIDTPAFRAFIRKATAAYRKMIE